MAGASRERRTALTWISRVAMAGGLVAAYGTLAGFMARFLYPARPTAKGWMFVIETARVAAGDSLRYRTPDGATVNVTRTGAGHTAADFIALSSTCPHLGCQVHWEPQHDRYFCPCHNGTFDPSGIATGGPPADAGQSLPRYALQVERGLLYIEVPTEQLAAGPGAVVAAVGPPGPGHDPCLYASRSAAPTSRRA